MIFFRFQFFTNCFYKRFVHLSKKIEKNLMFFLTKKKVTRKYQAQRKFCNHINPSKYEWRRLNILVSGMPELEEGKGAHAPHPHTPQILGTNPISSMGTDSAPALLLSPPRGPPRFSDLPTSLGVVSGSPTHAPRLAHRMVGIQTQALWLKVS